MRMRRPCLPKLSLFSVIQCLNGCRVDSGHGTRIWNLTDRKVELQIRVGSILKKVYILKPGSSKKLKCKNIYKAYYNMPGREGLLYYYYDGSCEPYVWIHDSMRDFSRMVKQQYVSLEDLRDCSEIRIFRDSHKGDQEDEYISVLKKPRH